MNLYSKILITGATGQIGHELVRELSALGSVVAPPRSMLDLESPTSIRSAIHEIQPTLVVNAAAYTAVDLAESEPERCALMNTAAPEILAQECRKLGAALVHFSTDYVFDGTKQSPYSETDQTAPLSVYGRTKRDGEEAVAAAGGAFLIVRTTWVYGIRGKNFPMTILRLAREREELKIVNDQVGAPTSSLAVANGVSQMLRVIGRQSDPIGAFAASSGIYHMTASGSTTWYDFARRILADDPRSVEHVCRTVRPTTSAEYAQPAQRPAYSVLDNTKLAQRFGVTLPPWTEQWRVVGDQLRLSSLRTPQGTRRTKEPY